jgi:primosomal protein N'
MGQTSKSNITGKVFRVIHSIYDNVKSCINNNDKCSSFFRCDIDVRQRENLPPFLFAIYLNDLEQFFVENNVNDLENIRNMC